MSFTQYPRAATGASIGSTVTGATQGSVLFAGAAGVLAQIGYSRGALTPDQPMVPGLFTTAAAELVCETLAGRFFGSGNGLASTVVFEADKKSEAIEIQEKAVKLADGDMKAELQKVLDSYKEGKLPKAE